MNNIYESIMSFKTSSSKKTFTEELGDLNAPNVSVNLPLNAGLSFNFVPNMEGTKGEFTDLMDLDDTVKVDPFADSIIPNPEDPDAEEVEEDDIEEVKEDDSDIETTTDSDEARFLTLQDLM